MGGAEHLDFVAHGQTSVKFTVEPRLLDHFGIAMYNTVPKSARR